MSSLGLEGMHGLVWWERNREKVGRASGWEDVSE